MSNSKKYIIIAITSSSILILDVILTFFSFFIIGLTKKYIFILILFLMISSAFIIVKTINWIKKNIFFKCLITSIVFLVISSFIALSIIITSNNPPYQDLIITNENAYTKIADICYQNYLNQNRVMSHYEIHNEKNNYELFCSSTNMEILLNEENINNAKTILDSYYVDKHLLLCITVDEDFITFRNNAGRASIIYSPTNKRPQFVNASFDDFICIQISKIKDNWYYAFGFDSF